MQHNNYAKDASLLSEAYTKVLVSSGVIKENLAPKHPEHVKIDIKDTEDLEVSGVDPRDYPDFADAFFSAGYLKGREEPLTDEELDYLSDNYGEELNRAAHEHYIMLTHR